MGRYLTPGRICLLTLIEIYLSCQTPADADLPILNLITQQILVPLASYSDQINKQDVRLTSNLSHWARELRTWPSDVPGKNIYDILLKRIWGLDGLDSLHQLFNDVSDILNQQTAEVATRPRRISATSPLGQFIRRCCVEFTRLQFNDSLTLWISFLAHRQPSYDEWSLQHTDESPQHQQRTMERTLVETRVEISNPSNFNGHLCVTDVDDLMTNVVQNLQRFSTRVPKDVKVRLENWISTQWEAGTQSLRFFVAFFEQWRAGQYILALESLHQYFDYSLAARRASDNMRSQYQYALLHLSVLHADFECWDESIDAMNECIATARENQDIACLNFALSWLLYLRHANPRRLYTSNVVLTGTPENVDHDEMAFLKTKAKESKQWLLMSSALLEQAKTEIYTGGNTAHAQECILQSMFLNNQHDLRTFMPAVSMLYGASLERLGQTHIATRTYEAIVAIHAPLCPIPDKVNAFCRVAYLKALRGEFSQAISELESLMNETHHIPKHNNRIIAYIQLIQFRQSIHQYVLDHKTHLLDRLGFSFACNTDNILTLRYRGHPKVCFDLLPRLKAMRHLNDPEYNSEVRFLEVESLIQVRRFAEALDQINEWLLELENLDFDLAQHLASLRQRAQVLAKGTETGKVLTAALRMASVAERLLFPNLLSMATDLLTCILAEHSEFTTAYEMLQSIIPLATETQDQSLILQLMLKSSDMCVGVAAQAHPISLLESQNRLRLALNTVKQVEKVSTRIDFTQVRSQCLSRRSLLELCKVEGMNLSS